MFKLLEFCVSNFEMFLNIENILILLILKKENSKNVKSNFEISKNMKLYKVY